MEKTINQDKSILIISGHDPFSGSGITSDIKTSSKLKTHASYITTCLTVQNNINFISSNAVNIDIIKNQIDAITKNVEINAIKIGLLPNSKVISAINDIITKKLSNIPIILDPIISSTTKTEILDNDSILLLKETLLKKIFLITPNIQEAEILANIKIKNQNDIKIAAEKIKRLGVKNILIKGGHLDCNNDIIYHYLLKEDLNSKIIQNERIKLDSDIRGTGCSLSTAIACFLSKEFDIEESIQKANNFVIQEIKRSVKIGGKFIMI